MGKVMVMDGYKRKTY